MFNMVVTWEQHLEGHSLGRVVEPNSWQWWGPWWRWCSAWRWRPTGRGRRAVSQKPSQCMMHRHPLTWVLKSMSSYQAMHSTAPPAWSGTHKDPTQQGKNPQTQLLSGHPWPIRISPSQLSPGYFLSLPINYVVHKNDYSCLNPWLIFKLTIVVSLLMFLLR